MVFCPSSQSSCEYYGYQYPYNGEKISDDDRARQYEKSLMPRPRSGGTPADYYPQQSRDYALSNTILCECTVCPANKNNFCEVPALIKISSTGKCTTGTAFVEQQNKVERDPSTIGKW